MGDMLSQEEINALLGGIGDISQKDKEDENDTGGTVLNSEDIDIIGEIGNITMGTSATTLFALLGQKVLITTPIVKVVKWDEIADGYTRPCVGIRVDYTEGIEGSNLMILKQSDVKIISSLMMGGDGKDNVDEELNEIDLSAIAEAMNQMVGSSSTSLSSLVKLRIDIDTPHAFVLDFKDDDFMDNVSFAGEEIVCTKFRMEIGDLVDSEIMQILPMKFARNMINIMRNDLEIQDDQQDDVKPTEPTVDPIQQQDSSFPQTMQQESIPQTPPPMDNMYAGYQQPPPQQPQMDMYAGYQPPPQQQPQMGMYAGYQPPPQQPQMGGMYGYQPPPQQPQMGGMYTGYQPPNVEQTQSVPLQQNVNVQPVQFQNFDVASVMQQKENINIVMDVPLEVTVELGRATKKIRDILEFSQGTIIELDKLAGEPIDILVNGKFVARGEVVVIDENFGVRVTDIVNAENRI